jgi:hypothetical protein
MYAIATCHNKIGNIEEAISTYNKAFTLESESSGFTGGVVDWKSATGGNMTAGNFQEATTPSYQA